MKHISRVASGFCLAALLLTDGCVGLTGSSDNSSLAIPSNLIGNWYRADGNETTGNKSYLNVSSANSRMDLIQVELMEGDTAQIYRNRFNLQYLENNLFLVRKSGAGSVVYINFTSCSSAKNVRCTYYDDTLDIGGVIYVDRTDSSLRTGGALAYLSDSSKMTSGKFYSLGYRGGKWIKYSTEFFSVNNGIRSDYHNSASYATHPFTSTASTFTYNGATSRYLFNRDTLYVFGTVEQTDEHPFSEFKPSTQSPPTQLFH